MVHAVELAKVVLPPLVIFGLFYVGFWLLNRHATAIGDTLATLGISKVGFMGVAVEVVHDRLRAAASERQDAPPFSEKDEQEVRRLTKHLAPLVGGGRVLWVDDDPSGNRHERAALTRLGIEVQTRRTNDEAEKELLNDAKEPYGLVISDLRREPYDPKREPEGFTLLKWVRENRPAMPFIIYTWTSDPAGRKSEAGKLGAHGLTNSPVELYRWTLAWLAAQRRGGRNG